MRFGGRFIVSCYAKAFNVWVQVVDNRCGHVSIMLFEQSVRFWVWVCDKAKNVFLMLTRVVRVTVSMWLCYLCICAFQKWFEGL